MGDFGNACKEGDHRLDVFVVSCWVRALISGNTPDTWSQIRVDAARVPRDKEINQSKYVLTDMWLR